MEEFSFDQATRITKAKMYGFHFTDNQDISIICKVTVCTAFNGGCNKPNNGTGCLSMRKKRSVDLIITHDLKQHSHLIKRRMSNRFAQKENSVTVGKTIRIYDLVPDVAVQKSAVLTLLIIIMILVKLVV